MQLLTGLALALATAAGFLAVTATLMYLLSASLGAYGAVVGIVIAQLLLVIFVAVLARPLVRASAAIDAMNSSLGRAIAWAILAAVLISAVNAIVRKAFNVSSNSWLEAQWVLFGAVFLLCSPWTMMSNEHIRIDVVTSLLPKRARDMIDVFGHAFFLISVAFVVLYTGAPFFWRSLLQDEQSTNAGGLPVYPAKLLIPLAFFLLFLQGFSELIKRLAIMRGFLEDTASGGGHHAAAEAEAERLRRALAEDTATAEAAMAPSSPAPKA